MNIHNLARESSTPSNNWLHQYKSSIRNIEDLCKVLELPLEKLPISASAIHQFPIRVPMSYVERIQKSNIFDPLLLQILPQIEEEDNLSEYSEDPVEDNLYVISPGLLQKYKRRALLITSSQCAIHCRYCFRRHFPYSDNKIDKINMNNTIAELKANADINEIILSGGDPLSLHDTKLANLINKLETVASLKTLRIHTRLPVVIPSRITIELVNILRNTRFKVVIVLHINHAQEINNEVEQAVIKLSEINCTLLNQSVLLKNVNDNAEDLIKLSEKLFENGILPYYLHMLDKVKGASHFEVNNSIAVELMKNVSSNLPGYLVPRLTREEPGMPSKSLVFY